jgi:uncharacterized protein YhaN
MTDHAKKVEEIRQEHERHGEALDQMERVSEQLGHTLGDKMERAPTYVAIDDLLLAYDAKCEDFDRVIEERDKSVQRQQKWRSRFEKASSWLRRVVIKTGHAICLCDLGDNGGCVLHNKKGS